MREMKLTSSNKLGHSRLPRRINPPANTISLREALTELKGRPDIFFDDPQEATLDVAAMEIGMALRLARTRKGLTQERLAELTSIAQGTISAIECGRGRDGPSYRVIRELASALDVVPALRPLHPVRELIPECYAISATPQTLAFERVIEDADFCWDLVRTCLPRRDFEGIKNYIETSVAAWATGASDVFLVDAACAFWSIEPNSHAQLNLQQDTLVVAMNPVANIKEVSSTSRPAQFSFACGAVEVFNAAPTVSAVVTAPITASIVAKLSK